MNGHTVSEYRSLLATAVAAVGLSLVCLLDTEVIRKGAAPHRDLIPRSHAAGGSLERSMSHPLAVYRSVLLISNNTSVTTFPGTSSFNRMR